MDTVRVGYCGTKQSRPDTSYGTGLTWTPGQVHDVPRDKWERMRVHKDIWYEVPAEPSDIDLMSMSFGTAPTGTFTPASETKAAGPVAAKKGKKK